MSTPARPLARRHRKAIIALAAAAVLVTVLVVAAVLAIADRRPDAGAAATPDEPRWSGVSPDCPVLPDDVAKALGLKTDPLPASQVQQPKNPVGDGYTAAGMRTCQWMGSSPGAWLVATVYVFGDDPDRGRANDVARDVVTGESSLKPVDCTVPTLTQCRRGAVIQTEFAATADNAVIGLHCSDKPRPADSSLAAVSNELLSMLAV